MTGIVVLNYNTYDATIECISAIEKRIKCEYKIYLVDNASEESCKDKLKNKYSSNCNVNTIFLDKNLGYSGGNNVGISTAINEGASEILILNSDVIILNDIVSIMKKELSSMVAIVGPKIYTPMRENGQFLRKNYTFASALTDKKPFYYVRKTFPKLDSCYSVKNWDASITFEGMVSGCCFLISSDVFKQIGLFDDNVFLYAEEYILGKKLQNVNLMACYCPEAIIVHNHGASTRKIGNGFSDYHRYASLYYCFKRYCNPSKYQVNTIRFLTLTNFFLKSFFHPDFKENYIRLRTKVKEIDNGQFKIVF